MTRAEAEIQIANYLSSIAGLNAPADLVKAGVEAILALVKE